MRVHRERLMGELIAVLNRLQVAQRNAAAKEKESMKVVAAQDQQRYDILLYTDPDAQKQNSLPYFLMPKHARFWFKTV
ncbi:unnamed protein product [Gongylonema pulchrum]|uniref:Nup54 domain-containing protein n=1 Tax=Gongylonema pulchrum TaxID=637853 RepID=A0A183ELL3_9BILA|nr:unnamed protein product [Gongylonema pulchrum]